MGQAKRRNAEVQKWLASLSPEEVTISDAAQRLLLRVIDPLNATGMCYRLTFFLHLFLRERNIVTRPVVGYVNDGSDDVYISHAWLDYAGKKTDLTLARMERPDVTPPGDVLILDFPFRRQHKYSYHLAKSTEAIAFEKELLRDPANAAALRHKNAEHAMMTGLSKDQSGMREYLDAAPDGLTYRRFTSFIVA